MKTLLRNLSISGVLFLSALTLSGCISSSYTYPTSYDYSYNNPSWAPQYYTGTRYYYFPDIECYYDINHQNFVFLNNGQWVYTESISSYYPSFNLYNSYIVIVNINVYQPWMHHQYYNSHYPRYYYRDYYDHSNIPYVRGFNENRKSAFYWEEKDRSKARDWDDKNIINKRNFQYSDDDRRIQEENSRHTNNSGRERPTSNENNGSKKNWDDNNQHGNKPNDNNTTNNNQNNTGNNRGSSNNTNTNSSSDNSRSNNTNAGEKRSDTNYYGRPIGRPVKVEKQMRESSSSTNSSSRSSNSSNSRGSENSSKTSRSTTTNDTNNNNRSR